MFAMKKAEWGKKHGSYTAGYDGISNEAAKKNFSQLAWLNHELSSHEWLSHKWSNREFSVLSSAVGRWKREGRTDPVLLRYDSMHEAEEAKIYFEEQHDIHDIATLGAAVLVGEDAEKMEDVLEYAAVQRFFDSKLRVAAQHWCTEGADHAMVLDFASPKAVHYAHIKLDNQFGVYNGVNERGHTLEIESHCAEMIVEKMHLDAVMH